MKLVYVNELGPNFRGDNIYEFIFSDMDDVWGDEWDSEPASGKPSPPQIDFIKKVGVLKNSGLHLNLIQNSDFFSVYDSVEGVIALGWEDSDSEAVTEEKMKRSEANVGFGPRKQKQSFQMKAERQPEILR